MLTKIRYSVDNLVYDVTWKVKPGSWVVNICIMYNNVETIVKPDQIVEWLP